MRTLYMGIIPAALAVTLAVAAADPGGWTKARWGMSSAEILKLFQGEATGETPRLTIPSYEVAGTKFRVLLILDKADHLDHVSLSPIEMADSTDDLFQSLEEMLVQKYGHPWKSDEAGTTDLQWTFPTTVITLSRTKAAVGVQLLSVSYRHRQPDKM